MIPELNGSLRKNLIILPKAVEEASGIRINGKLIKSLLFSTDVAIIRNTNADAIIAVYPFTPQPIITEALMLAAQVPVFCGVGGGTTSGQRVINLALHAEFQGAIGVVVNAPIPNKILNRIAKTVDIPIVVTVVSTEENITERIANGAQILNISGAHQTPAIVRKIRENHIDIPIIATGGPSESTILETIRAGANAITYTPPTNGEIFRNLMNKYRDTMKSC